MARIRTKPIRSGDKVTLLIPENADPKLLKMLNTPKYMSPYVIEILTQVAYERFPDINTLQNENKNNHDEE
ncbi:hypothetical protein [Senegalia massiliensis]|uniref:Uncharacterized protein n=1 Tax=Senegalia massiliensis TaxID=1720316 RepID=A0A845R065_9CLOT|nr:hypothetical protein [Senegalia massiliensis]NBI07604.1 hypothetical protein [Senegalia massiliensis]